MNIELYINKQLCDIEDTKKFSIAFKRQFLNPAELNTKDAQLSYSITIPATHRNNSIFGFKNIEEVGDKFSIYDDARLHVNGVLVIDGKFRLSQITKSSYIGNLIVLAPITAKDVFGDTTLNNAGEWKIDNFLGFDSISEYNTKENSECIFPLALYGLLPKYALSNGEYTGKTLFDEHVILGLNDFLPSISCIEMLKKIFSNSGYTLSGTALADEKLNKLYMSYKNPNEYEFDWGISKMSLRGGWKHCIKVSENSWKFESRNKYAVNSDRKQYAVNIFDSLNNEPVIQSDTGGNINIKGTRTTIIIPRSGLYKIRLHNTIIMLDDNVPVFSPTRDVIGVKSGTLNDAPIEIHLVKNLERSLDEIQFNNKFSRDNINQDINDETAIFPQPHRVNFIDPLQDKNFLCGFAFGRHGDENYRNPLNGDYCNPMAITGGRSWDFDNGEGTTDRTYSAVYSPNYQTRQEILGGFKVDLLNADTSTGRHSNELASGDTRQIVWLEKGDRLDLITTTNIYQHGIFGYSICGYKINYSLDIEPFNHYINWLKIDSDGSSTEPMNWNDKGTFVENQIDLIKSLPSEIKINDWIENFCKAFNLILYNTGSNSFNLDLKNKGTIKNTSIIIDLDNKASVNQASNDPLGVPYMYELGFTTDASEEGYYSSQKFTENDEPIVGTGEDGGGTFYTGSQETSKVTQTSFFSYCWYKDFKYVHDNSILKIPIITDKEIWENDYDYKEMLNKLYYDKSMRFWYKSGAKELYIDYAKDKTATIALVSNEYTGSQKAILNYKDQAYSIMRNYFLLLTNERYYTVVECYLTPEEYSNLGISLVRFNGDLYNIAEIDGYDPLGRRKATLKLIRKIL